MTLLEFVDTMDPGAFILGILVGFNIGLLLAGLLAARRNQRLAMQAYELGRSVGIDVGRSRPQSWTFRARTLDRLYEGEKN